MVDLMSLMREIDAHFVDLWPGKVGLEGCESLLTHLHNKKTIAEKFRFATFWQCNNHWRWRSWPMSIGFPDWGTRRIVQTKCLVKRPPFPDRWNREPKAQESFGL